MALAEVGARVSKYMGGTFWYTTGDDMRYIAESAMYATHKDDSACADKYFEASDNGNGEVPGMTFGGEYTNFAMNLNYTVKSLVGLEASLAILHAGDKLSRKRGR